jgi:hypothetical protein
MTYRYFILIFLVSSLFNDFIFGQDTLVSINKYDIAPTSLLTENALITTAFEQNQIDYWEYRTGYFRVSEIDCPWDSIGCDGLIKKCFHSIKYYGGNKWSNNDSILLINVNACRGMLISPYIADFYYLIIKKNNKFELIDDIDSIFLNIKPINTLEKSIYYCFLNGFSIQPDHGKIYYKRNKMFYELIMTSETADRYEQKKKGGILYNSVYYLKINENGDIYKRKIGEKSRRIDHFVLP